MCVIYTLAPSYHAVAPSMCFHMRCYSKHRLPAVLCLELSMFIRIQGEWLLAV
jgi:hypothetical protein